MIPISVAERGMRFAYLILVFVSAMHLNRVCDEPKNALLLISDNQSVKPGPLCGFLISCGSNRNRRIHST
jgi:hypothetical protein